VALACDLKHRFGKPHGLFGGCSCHGHHQVGVLQDGGESAALHLHPQRSFDECELMLRSVHLPGMGSDQSLERCIVHASDQGQVHRQFLIAEQVGRQPLDDL